ncbi:MAG: DUF4097 family beta strand repeat protein [Verrucomicrobia bacterium]|nr:DUF4097 family beta strand repeat protein [Verrucomicrobiota bacterium]
MNEIKTHRLAGLLAGLVAATTLTSAWAAQDLTEEFHRTAPLPAEGRLSVENVNGAIRIESWDRAEVKVDAVKHAKTPEALRDVSIEFNAEADRVSVRTRYAREKEDRHNSARVDYRLMVPRRVRIEKLACVNGPIDLERVAGEVQVSTVNGSLKARQFAGSGSFRSVNGGIDIAVSRLDREQGLSFDTVNGQVEVSLPANTKATVNAETVNGSIHSDFDLPITKHRIGRKLEGELNGGGASIKLHAVNGSLSLKQTRARESGDEAAR